MHSRNQRESGHTRQGVVISDLHLFARRSMALDCLEGIRVELNQADVLVLNGDTFDFRWSTLRGLDTTQRAAADWLRGLRDAYPRCEIHFVLGNHDCLASFVDELNALAETLPRFQWHEYWLRLGPALFLHGDCAHRIMGEHELHRYREPWRRDRQRGTLGALAYACVDHLGFTRLGQVWKFPRSKTIQRVAHYLDRTCSGWRDGVLDCYFGHTHVPFSNYQVGGINFHNTGSAIRSMAFNPLVFAAPLISSPTKPMTKSSAHAH
jgi:hypothetical protein